MMIRTWFALGALAMLISFAGCGGSKEAGVSVEKDELAKYMEENPLVPMGEDDADLDLSSE